MVTRPTWDETFLEIAKIVSERATCSRRKVGAVLVQDNRIIATGYNGAASGAVHCIDGGCPRGQHFFAGNIEQPLGDYEDMCACGNYWPCSDAAKPGEDYNTYPCVAIHAEANALLRAGHAASKGGTLYITTAPCQQCWNLIQAAEVGRVVILDGSFHGGAEYRSLSYGGQD